MSLSPEILLMFAFVGLFAGAVDAIAGGGGLITVPALLLGGLDPVSAIATNKLQGSIGTAAATWRFARAGMIDFRSRSTWGLAAAAFVGAVIGSALVAVAPVEAMRIALPFLLIAVALYFAFGPRMSDVDAAARMTPLAFGLGVVAPIGAYDGLFGPGAGSFYMIALVALTGVGAAKAVARTKLLNMSSNLAGLIVFVAAGHVVWLAGFAMAAGTIAGAQLGSALALKHGVKLVRPLVIVVSLALAARLMFDPAHPVGQAVRSALGR
ncbi:TSUP family transporter [Chenggangzhangella methanolivorans]|uniref:Probable membrane transporter protein n=1 Tax=Chenggangzhangella methanolivorans TaxID=1437009 RepID=A0A9E6RIP9_9HYPH|nr:TSUP family transporter [Chenggangzhangella methanolivorans]QZO02196.1 TSUP family transporter [Chenggangzhangella methanolivorans]